MREAIGQDTSTIYSLYKNAEVRYFAQHVAGLKAGRGGEQDMRACGYVFDVPIRPSLSDWSQANLRQ